jgi:hypothetical protein
MPKPKVGNRVRITGVLPNDPDPVEVGVEDTVDWIGGWDSELTRQFGVKWAGNLVPPASVTSTPFLYLYR